MFGACIVYECNKKEKYIHTQEIQRKKNILYCFVPYRDCPYNHHNNHNNTEDNNK